MFKGILTLLALLLAGAVNAQDITISMALIRPGSTITMRTSEGAVFTHHMLGQSAPGEFSFETYAGPHSTGDPTFIQYTDADGNLTRLVNAEGQTHLWLPHRCNRTLGLCDFIEVRPDGTRHSGLRTTTQIPGGFSYLVINPAGETVLEGNAQLDLMGWTKSVDFRRGNRPAIQV